MADRQQQFMYELPSKGGRKLWKFFLGFLIFVAFVLFAIYSKSLPPSTFPIGEQIEIPEGTSIQKAGLILEDKGVITSPSIFQTLVILFSNNKGVRSGFYVFDRPESVVGIAQKLAAGHYGLGRVKITLPEGLSAKDMTPIISGVLPKVDAAAFAKIGKENEGYLFPETYFFFETATTEEVFKTLTDEFKKQMAPYQEEITTSGHTEKEILIMASIIEKETNGKDDYETISGILWNRLTHHMRLQVDATFIYTMGVGRDEIRPEDIKNDTSAYNTYTHDGLPPGPIANPGLRSILAALRPAETPYLFYLHEKDGTIHYAKTFDEHKKNIQKYLR